MTLGSNIDLKKVAALAVDSEEEAGAGVLGKLVMYTISDSLRITPAELVALFEHFDIDTRFLPKEINPGGVLKAVLRSKKLDAVIRGKTYTVEFRIEEKVDGSLYTPLRRERRRTREEREGLARAGGRSSTEWKEIPEWDTLTVAAVVFDPSVSLKIRGEVLPEHATEYPYGEVLKEVEADYEHRRQFYARDAISGVVSDILNSTTSIPSTRRGGVWVVPRDAMPLLDQVEQMVRLMDAEYRREAKENDRGRPTEFDSIILVDKEKNRLYVRDKVEEKVLKELAVAIERLAALARARVAPKPRELADASALRKQALGYRDRFADVVGNEYDRIGLRLADFDRAFAAAMAAGRGA